MSSGIDEQRQDTRSETLAVERLTSSSVVLHAHGQSFLIEAEEPGKIGPSIKVTPYGDLDAGIYSGPAAPTQNR